MFRIWGRIEKEHKIVRQVTYESEAKKSEAKRS